MKHMLINFHPILLVKCDMPLDFAIIVDTSGSISRRNFRLLLRFIRAILAGFEIGEDLTHVALIEYSTEASVQLNFNDLTGRKLDRYNVDMRVRNLPHRRGATYIDRALRLADKDVFNYTAGMRNFVKKVRLILCLKSELKYFNLFAGFKPFNFQNLIINSPFQLYTFPCTVVNSLYY